MKRYALVTGGSSGIGKAIAAQLARTGYHLVIVSDNGLKLERAARDLEAINPDITVTSIVKDLTQTHSPREIVDELAAKRIEISVLVNDAGVGHWGVFATTPLEKDLYVIRLNIEALVSLTKLILPGMLARGAGKILNVGSVAGFQPGPLLAVYHATKAFVVSFSEALAEELKDSPVTVTCVCPGATATDFFRRAQMEQAWIVQKGHIMDPETVAIGAVQAMSSGDRLYIPGVSNKILTFMRRMIPESAQAKLTKKFYQPVAVKH